MNISTTLKKNGEKFEPLGTREDIVPSTHLVGTGVDPELV